MNYSFLLIEDTKSHMRSYKETIESLSRKIHFDHKIDEATNYQEAKDKIKNKYDVIILDRKIPQDHSLDILNEIKDLYPFQRIIFITAYPTRDLSCTLKLKRIHAYVEKKGDYRTNLENELSKILKKDIHCFFITPFSSQYLSFFKKIVKPYLEDLGFKPILADDVFDENTVIDKVKEGIKKSFFVISNISKQNANVWYETGLSHQSKKPTILITNNTKTIPSDLQGEFYFKYDLKDIDEFKRNLHNKIRAIEINLFSKKP